MRNNNLNDKELESIHRVFQLIDEECNGKAQTFADKAGIGKSSVSHYKHFLHAPSQDHAYKIGRAFNVNPMWVMGFDVPKYDSSFIEATKCTDCNEEERKVIKAYRSSNETMKQAICDMLHVERTTEQDLLRKRA